MISYWLAVAVALVSLSGVWGLVLYEFARRVEERLVGPLWRRDVLGWESVEVQDGRPVWSVRRLGWRRWLAQVSWCEPGMVCRSAREARAACERYEHDYWLPDGRYWERDLSKNP
jgi:hypothetical protein